MRVVFVGSPDEQDDGSVLAGMADDKGIVNLIGKTNLAQLLDLMANAALVVSNDTGPAHLSIALGRSTVVIVGGGHFGSFVPYPDAITPKEARFVYQEMECYHCFWRCHKRADKFQLFPCIGAIEEDRVWAACEALIGPDAA
jgi:ADP-heptose:LPS heptosyltransferase